MENQSTRVTLIINFWRVVNLLFECFLTVLKSLGIETREEFPYMKLRYGYYFIKRKVTVFLSRLLAAHQKINIKNYSSYCRIYQKYAASNNRLLELVDMDLKQFDYPCE